MWLGGGFFSFKCPDCGSVLVMLGCEVFLWIVNFFCLVELDCKVCCERGESYDADYMVAMSRADWTGLSWNTLKTDRPGDGT